MKLSRLAAGAAVAVVVLTVLVGCSASAAQVPAQTAQGAAASPAPASSAGASTPQPTQQASATPATASKVQFTEGTVKQWGHVEVSADGFAPGESVAVTATKQGVQPVDLGTAKADGNGHVDKFGADLPEAVTSGAWTITLTGQSSKRQASNVLYVRSEKMFAVLSSYAPKVGDKLGFVVGGFDPGEDVQVFLQNTTGKPLAKMTADKAGNTTWTEIKLDGLQPGEQKLIFQGSGGKNQYVQTLTISPLTPTLELSPWSGPPGTAVNLNGRGFLPNEDVQVFVGDANQPTKTFKADQYGNYWGIGPLTIPVTTTDGKAQIRLVGQQSGAQITQGFAIVGVKPWAELSNYSGPPGSPISFAGGGFAANEKVTAHLGNASGPVVATIPTDETGRLGQSDVVTVPGDTPSGPQANVTYTLVGESSHGQASAVFTVISPVVPGLAGESQPGSQAPAAQPAPPQQPTPVPQPTPAGQLAPAEQPTPAGQVAPAEQPTPAGQPTPAEQPTPAQQPTQPAQQSGQ